MNERSANIGREAGDPDPHAARGSGDERLRRIAAAHLGLCTIDTVPYQIFIVAMKTAGR